MKIKVGVIFGGNSVEHEISIISAVQAMEYLDKEKYEVVPIYIDKNKDWYSNNELKKMETYKDIEKLKKEIPKVSLIKKDKEFILMKTNGLKKIVNTIDIAFPIVHGKGVEDGSLAGYLETIGIPYVGTDMLGAAIGQDKVIQKQILASENIPVVNYVWFYENDYLNKKEEILNKIKDLGYPVIVKPARLGSSIGINYVKNEDKIVEYLEEAFKFDEKVIVEEVIPNLLEVDCAVLGDYNNMKTSLIGEMLTNNEFLTFEDKYLNDNSKIHNGFKIPANIDEDLAKNIYDLAKKSFKTLNLKGVTRFDFLINKETKEIYVNEPNTIPGCLAFFFFTKLNISYKQLLDNLINMTIKNYKNSKEKISSFESNVLSTFNGCKSRKLSED